MKHKWILIVIAIVVLSIAIGLSTKKEDDKVVVKDITISELKKLLDKDYQFIDIRTKEEFDGVTGPKHIDGFINIDYYQFQNDTSLLSKLDKNKPVVIMCNSGHRSGLAKTIFQDLGFKEIYNVLGGIRAWTE